MSQSDVLTADPGLALSSVSERVVVELSGSISWKARSGMIGGAWIAFNLSLPLSSLCCLKGLSIRRPKRIDTAKSLLSLSHRSLLWVLHCTLSNHGSQGCAVLVDEGSTLSLLHSHVNDSKASGVYCPQGTVNVSYSQFEANNNGITVLSEGEEDAYLPGPLSHFCH